MADTEDRPVLTGLIALVAVAAVIGVIGGLVALMGSKVLGLDGDAAASSEASSSSDATLFLPEPTITSETVVPESAASPTNQPSKSATEKVTAITLSAGQQSVGAMEQIDLIGTYTGGEGAILQVQQFDGGAWSDFPVTMSVSSETFSTYVQTSQAGQNRFRVIDTDKDLFSNEVIVTVG